MKCEVVDNGDQGTHLGDVCFMQTVQCHASFHLLREMLMDKTQTYSIFIENYFKCSYPSSPAYTTSLSQNSTYFLMIPDQHTKGHFHGGKQGTTKTF